MSKTFVSWVNLAFVQSKLLQKLNWSGIRRRWRMRSWGGFHASPAPFHWNHRCFKRWNCERTFSSAPPAKDKSFQRTTRDSNGLLIEKNLPWNFPRFVRVCSWLGSLDSPWPVARSCSSVFFCLNIIIFCWGGKRRRSGDKWIHLCEIWHPMSAPGLFWVLSELFTGAKLGSVGRLTNQRWGTLLPVVSLVEKLPRTAPLISLWDRRMGTEEEHSTVRGGFPGKA